MTKREKDLIHYTVVMKMYDDARHTSRALRNAFTPEERREIKKLTLEYAKLNRKQA